jgi:hypothetical protein
LPHDKPAVFKLSCTFNVSPGTIPTAREGTK